MSSWKKAGLWTGLIVAVVCWSACGENYRPTAWPIVSPGGNPQSTNYAYVLFTNPNGPGGVAADGMLEQIDVSGDTVTLDEPVGRNPVFAAFLGTGTGEIFTANQADGSVTEQSFLDANPPTVITLPPSTSPVSLGSTQATAIYVVDSASPSYCANGAVDVLSSGNVITNTVCVGKNPVAIKQLPNGGKVYVVNQGDNTVSVIDPVSLQILATIPAGTNPVWVSTNLDGSYVFVVNKGSNTLTAIHTADNTTTSITVGSTSHAAPNFSIFDPSRNRLYVTNSGENTVTVLDLSQATPSVLAQAVSLGAGALGPTTLVPLADGSRYYVANTLSNNVSVIDANSNTPVAITGGNPIPLFPSGTTAPTTQPLWIESEPTSTKVYVTTPAPTSGPFQTGNPNGAPGVTIIRTADNTIENFVQAPQADSSCQPNPVTGVTCNYQFPLQILSIPR